MDTDKPAALALIELEFRSVDFCGGRKTGEPKSLSRLCGLIVLVRVVLRITVVDDIG